jgi:hypothetical protein
MVARRLLPGLDSCRALQVSLWTALKPLLKEGLVPMLHPCGWSGAQVKRQTRNIKHDPQPLEPPKVLLIPGIKPHRLGLRN